MNFKVKVFLSYSIKDKKFAENLVNELKEYPFMDIFMAPKDIKPGTFWMDELKYNLKNSDVILSLLTNNYHEADWTEQEIGLAWAFEKRIVALSIDGNMGNGYVKTIQIKKFPIKFETGDVADLAIEIYPSIKDKKEFVEGLLKFGLLASRNFRQSTIIARIVRKLVGELEPALASFVVEAYCKNDQVYRATTWNRLIEKAFCEDKPFIHFEQEQKKTILEFMKEKFPEYYKNFQIKIDNFNNSKVKNF